MLTRISRTFWTVVLASTIWIATPLPAAQNSSPGVEDLIFGTWILNPEKSTFSPGPPPRSQTRIYEAHEKGVRAIIHTVYADGHSTSSEYIAAYDGVEYPITGSPVSDRIAMKKIDAFTAEVTVTHAGKPTATARRVVSRDGTTMTITYEGQWADKPNAHNIAVYDRQGAERVSSQSQKD